MNGVRKMVKNGINITFASYHVYLFYNTKSYFEGHIKWSLEPNLEIPLDVLDLVVKKNR